MKLLMYLGVIYVVICFSCQSGKKQTNYVESEEVDFILQDSFTVRIPDMIDSVRYIKLETNEQCLLGRIINLKYYDRKLFIRDDQKNLYVFNDDGQFLNKIGTQGRGPGEYFGIFNFYLDKTNKRVGIITYGTTIILYDFEGKFVKNISGAELSFSPYILAGTIYKGSFFLYIDDYERICSVQICDPETMNPKIALNPYPLNGRGRSRWSYYPFAETKDGITFIKPYSDTLFRFDGISVKPRYVLEHTTVLATQQVFDTYYNLKQENPSITYGISEYLRKHNYFRSITSVFETSDYLLFKYDNVFYMWNKKLKKGGYWSFFRYIEKKDIYRSSLMGILASTDECFIKVLDYSEMDVFKSYSVEGYRIDLGMQQILTEWKEDDNPVVALYYMKKEI